MQICRGFTDQQWKSLRQRLENEDGSLTNDEQAWLCAIQVFERRLSERFLSCIDALEKADPALDVEVPVDAPADCSTLPSSTNGFDIVPGFAIMSLCCLLAETLQSFRQKPNVDSESGTNDAFRAFLSRPSFQGAFDDPEIATRFVNGVRNGIMHEAETRRWAIWRSEPTDAIVSLEGNNRYAVNRTKFAAAVREEFAQYLRALREEGAVQLALRERFLKKMNDIAREC